MADASAKSICVDLLVKDEIQYELALRGKNLTGVETVRDLRYLLRNSLKKFDLPDHKNLQGKLIQNEELDTIMTKIKALSVDIPDVATKDNVRTIDIARFDTKLGHLRTRLHNLQYFEIGAENKDIAEKLKQQVTELLGVLNVVKNKIGESNLESAVNKLSISNIQEEELISPKVSATSSVNSVVSNTDNSNKLQPLTSTPEQQIKLNEVNQVPFKIDTAKQLQGEPMRLKNAPNPVQNCSATSKLLNPPLQVAEQQMQSLNTMFAALPNPITGYLQSFKITNGLNTMEILDFIKNMLKLKDEMHLNDNLIVNLITGFAQGPLLSKILELKSIYVNVEFIHKGILEHFLPLNLRERLKSELVLRPQFTNEPLSMYICNIKESAKVLDLQYSESELVQLIKYGIAPSDRAKLVFLGNPETFADLDQLVIHSHNVMYLDYEREFRQPVRQTNQHAVNNQARNINPKPRAINDDKVCYVCNRKGHIAKFCYSRDQNVKHYGKNPKNS